MSNETLEPTPEFNITIDNFLLHLQKILPYITKMKENALEKIKNIQDFPYSVSTPDSQEVNSLLQKICEPPHRRIGTPEAHLIEDFIAHKFHDAGLENITKEPLKITLWNASNWKLIVSTGEKQIEMPCFYVLNSGFTGSTGITAPLVYVGKGKPKKFEKIDVKGKIVVGDIEFPTFPYGMLTKAFDSYYVSDPNNEIDENSKTILTFARLNFPPQSIGAKPNKESIYWQAVDHGAVGIILILKDHPSNTNSHWGPYDGVMKPIPGLYVGKYDGMQLRKIARSDNATGTIILEGEQNPGTAHNIYGILPGKSDDMIMISTHHDSAFKGASEDGTGVAMVLAQLAAWSKIPRSERPRSILFLITAGHLYAGIGAETFARKQRNNLLKKVLVDVNLEHLCAKDVSEDPVTHDFSLKDELAIGVIFISRKISLVSTMIKMCQDHPLEKLILIPDNFFGTMPIGEAGHLVAQSGINVIHWIRSPYYLLTAKDTLDKIDVEKLGSTAKAITDLVGKLMLLPKDEF